MSLCHLHNIDTFSEHTQKILDACDNSVSLDINDIESLNDYDIYIVELGELDKDMSLKVKNIFDKKSNPLIHFIILKDYNLLLFQLAILLGVKYLITQNQDTLKVIEKIKSDIKKNQNKNDETVNESKKSFSISDRFSFVDKLKNRLIDKNASKDSLYVITIGIEDEKRLQETNSRSDVESFLSGLISYMDIILKKKLLISQYDRDFYVALFEGIDYEEMKKIAYDFYSDIAEYIAKKDFKLLVDLFVFNLKGFDFNDILDELENIQAKKIDKSKCEGYIKRIGNNNADISEKSVLDHAFKEHIEFKLFNIYHGLGIHTKSQIIKVTEDSIYIKFEALHGVLLSMEKQTIMQSSKFLKDIQADVKFIDTKKKIAMLENFKFLDTTAHGRKFFRVTPSGRMPLAVFLEGSSLNGNIIDLSIKSVAFRVKYSKMISIMRDMDVKVVFNIPTKRVDIGYTKLTLEAKVVFSIQEDDDLCKIVCDFTEESIAESFLMEYIYDRQKELIIELKKMVKLQ